MHLCQVHRHVYRSMLCLLCTQIQLKYHYCTDIQSCSNLGFSLMKIHLQNDRLVQYLLSNRHHFRLSNEFQHRQYMVIDVDQFQNYMSSHGLVARHIHLMYHLMIL